MVEVTQTMFRRILIYALGAVFLTAGGVRAQSPRSKPALRGLEGNAEYMSLLREDAQLQIREDSIVNAVERMRRQLREDPGKRQQYSQEILQLESRIFEIRNAKGTPDRPYQHHRAGVGAGQPERRGAAACGVC